MDFELAPDVTVVENDDPRVAYSHGWERVTAESRICTGGSFHRSYLKGASARFEFEGSHIWVIGHKSASHGNLKVKIDGQQEFATISARGEARELIPFRKLFEHEFTEPGPHRVEIINDLSGSEITIDFLAYRPMGPGRTWETPLGKHLVTIGDNDPRIEYSGYWGQHSAGRNGAHLGGSVHFTYDRHATASVSFESTHCWIVGDVGPDRGKYNVSVDGGLFETFSSAEPQWRGFVIKYERQFADLGPHRVVIRNEEQDKSLWLDAFIYKASVKQNAGVEPKRRLAENLTSSVSEQTESAT